MRICPCWLLADVISVPPPCDGFGELVFVGVGVMAGWGALVGGRVLAEVLPDGAPLAAPDGLTVGVRLAPVLARPLALAPEGDAEVAAGFAGGVALKLAAAAGVDAAPGCAAPPPQDAARTAVTASNAQ
ncbi:MAG: hypothetical protein ACYDAQ_00360 [Mycobacteriales bacterium]